VNQIRRLTKIPPKIHRAYLAEDYDGIGQYVLLALAKNSTSSAYKARIAAGDFGGGRVFPVGTPVIVHVNRGLIEILDLGNIPQVGNLDEFNRDEDLVHVDIGDTSGTDAFWGTADADFDWEVLIGANITNGSVDVYVSEEEGALVFNFIEATFGIDIAAQPPLADQVRLFSESEINLICKFTCLTEGKDYGIGIGISEYFAEVFPASSTMYIHGLGTPGNFTFGTPSGSTHGTFFFRVRYQTAGPTMAITLWEEGTAEPDPQVTVTGEAPPYSNPVPGFNFYVEGSDDDFQLLIDYLRFEPF